MNLRTVSATPFTEALGWTLVHFLWQGALIAIVLACALALLHKRSPRLRYAICCVALLVLAVMPLATLWQLSQPVLLSGPRITVDEIPDRLVAAAYGGHLDASLMQRIVIMVDRATPAILIFWLAGVVVLLVRLSMGLVVANRMKRIGVLPVSREFEQQLQRLLQCLSIARAVRVMHSALVQVPTVVGWLRPVILVPIGFLTGLSTEQVEAIIVHELAHIRRHDYLVSVLQTITEATLFYHPAWNARLFLYQLRSDKTGTRGAVYGAREEAYGGADRESAAAG